MQALEAFAGAWDNQYPQISGSWQENWVNLVTFFAYLADIRKVIYTTNAIESLNSVIRHAIKKRKVLPVKPELMANKSAFARRVQQEILP